MWSKGFVILKSSQFYHLVFTIVIIVTWWGVVGLRILAQHPSTDRRTEPDIKLEFFVFSLFFLLQNLLAPVYDWIHHGMDEREEFGRSFEIEEGFVQEEIRIRVLEANPPVYHQWRLDSNRWTHLMMLRRNRGSQHNVNTRMITSSIWWSFILRLMVMMVTIRWWK